jgi:hypothetical protein
VTAQNDSTPGCSADNTTGTINIQAGTRAVASGAASNGWHTKKQPTGRLQTQLQQLRQLQQQQRQCLSTLDPAAGAGPDTVGATDAQVSKLLFVARDGQEAAEDGEAVLGARQQQVLPAVCQQQQEDVVSSDTWVPYKQRRQQQDSVQQPQYCSINQQACWPVQLKQPMPIQMTVPSTPQQQQQQMQHQQQHQQSQCSPDQGLPCCTGMPARGSAAVPPQQQPKQTLRQMKEATATGTPNLKDDAELTDDSNDFQAAPASSARRPGQQQHINTCSRAPADVRRQLDHDPQQEQQQQQQQQQQVDSSPQPRWSATPVRPDGDIGSAGGGGAASGAEPWWMVLPDFVPVEVLVQQQINPRWAGRGLKHLSRDHLIIAATFLVSPDGSLGGDIRQLA